MQKIVLWTILVVGFVPDSAVASEHVWGYLLDLEAIRLFHLAGEEARIGRRQENNVVLTSPRVSRRHAVIRKTVEGVAFEDVGSSNGSTVNGERIERRRTMILQAGDILRLADTRLLFHESLDLLWQDELRHRFLGRFVRLKVELPQDLRRKSFGKLQYVNTESQALFNSTTNEVEMTYPNSKGPKLAGGFGVDSLAFVGRVAADEVALELSLWGVEHANRMASRRALYSNLKHTRLRIVFQAERALLRGTDGQKFPDEVIASVLDVIPMGPTVLETTLKMSQSLTIQDRAVAYRDAALTLAFRHRGERGNASFAVLAAECQGKWVEAWLAEKRGGLTGEERESLSRAVEEGLDLLAEARERGTQDKEMEDAEKAIKRATKHLGMAR